jgi:morphogenetic protein associated with SpoVID
MQCHRKKNQKKQMTAGKSENENEIRSAEAENKCQGCEPGTDTRWNRATARYIHFQPVQDEKIEDAIRIQPSDLKILWQKGLRQGSNSFLMHGYYQHQHLMIGKSKEGGYILGIPGFYGEKNMAEMFGFPEFRRVKAERTSERTDLWLLVQKSDINAVVKIL